MDVVPVKGVRVLLLLLPLLRPRVRASEPRASRASMDDDLLLPYAPGHGPSHSHRHTRDCQPIHHGNTTHESRPASNHSGLPFVQSNAFVTDVPGSSRFAYGHMTLVQDPLRTVSVLEPAGPGGCWLNMRASVEETAKAAGCVYALNAGFFDPHTGKCLGNLVSDSKRVLDSGGVQNAQFGIRRDGTLVFGYLSQGEVNDPFNPFVQLVTGVVWLLRSGEVYINQSLEAECDATQTTGQLRNFVDVVSARTAVGHDAEGRLVLFHLEGQTGVRGMSLWEVAAFLKKNGVVNAINLDGGGSTSFVVNGSLTGYPSDHCIPDSRWRCGREVSSILCVHPRRCASQDCSGHGGCVDGQCVCQPGWTGTSCHALLCQPPACGAHGLCTANGCVCDAGWNGTNCSQECLPGFYGDGCNQACDCATGSSCDPVHGRCTCPPGFQGNTCEQVCPLGFFGLSCAQECHCDDQCPCDPQTGSCNATLPLVTNNTLHRAGVCLAKQMTSRRQEDEAHSRAEQPYLTEPTWLIINLTLATLLSASLLVHLVQACRGSGPNQRGGYSYVPLADINDSGQT